MRHRSAFVTLTYRDVEGWAPLDITEYVKGVTYWAKVRGYEIGYTSEAEVQKRGAVD